MLLGLIVEQITGTPFAEYIGEHIFRPAGMHDSGYFASDQLPPRTAQSYIQNADGTWRSNIYAVPIVGGPDGGAYTTAADMAHFWQALLTHKLLTRKPPPPCCRHADGDRFPAPVRPLRPRCMD